MAFENQRQADLGDGTFVNPILGGDYPDPSVVRVGDDYYMTHSSFLYASALLIWHSRDLVNWEPVGNALQAFDGDIWAPELTYHEGRFYIYYRSSWGNHVIVSDDARGPWSKPVDLNVGWIDPGHVVGPDGRRWLHLSSGWVVQLTADGCKRASEPQKVYDGWPIPEDWVIEGFCLEGPKLFRRGEYYYMLTAEGGTAGPATSHMVIAARSKSPIGPWENSPINPIIRTKSREEKWWSIGHGTILETAAGEWWMMLHGYESGYHTLGRQTLLAPIEWTRDGWPVVPADFDLAKPYRKPRGEAVPNGMQLSDDFAGPELGLQWRFFLGPEPGRSAVENGRLVINGKGTRPNDCGPLACIPLDHAYEVEVEVETEGAGEGGLCLFYDRSCFLGLTLTKESLKVFRHTGDWAARKVEGTRAALRIRNDQHEVTMWVRPEGELAWQNIGTAFEVSGMNHNVFGGFLSLRIALTSTGAGRAMFRNFKYRALSH